MNALDINVSKAVNGDDGGTWDGPVKFSDLEILDTGTGKLYGDGKIEMDGSIASTKAILGRKYQPDATGLVTVDSGVTDNFTIDLSISDTFFVTLGPAGAATAGNITLSAPTTDPATEVKKGALIRIFWASAGGAAEFRTNSVFDSKLKFESDDDKFLLINSSADVTLWELENVGTAATPKFAVRITRGLGSA